MLRSLSVGHVGRSCISAMRSVAGAGGARARGLSADADAVFPITPFETHKIDAPPAEATSNSAELHQYFKMMYKMRRLEMEADSLYQRGFVRGFCHLYNGQEAVAVGLEAAVTYDDCLITAYRNHCQQLARGDSAVSVLSELTGRFTGCSKGKGGSMHLYKKDANYYGGNGIVGAQVPIGAGLAFAQKYNNTGNVAITMFGDGAANQGQIYEAINMSALWKLPTIFLAESNHFGMGTSIERGSASTKLYTRGDYIPGIKVDGMDVLAVREGMKFAAAHARENGPIYVEMDTYRYKGHSISDQGLGYRSVDDINLVKTSRDPIDRCKSMLLDNDWSTMEELKKEEKKIRKEIDAAVKAAETAPLPPDDEFFKDIYPGEAPPLRGTLVSNGNGK